MNECEIGNQVSYIKEQRENGNRNRNRCRVIEYKY